MCLLASCLGMAASTDHTTALPAGSWKVLTLVWLSPNAHHHHLNPLHSTFGISPEKCSCFPSPHPCQSCQHTLFSRRNSGCCQPMNPSVSCWRLLVDILHQTEEVPPLFLTCQEIPLSWWVLDFVKCFFPFNEYDPMIFLLQLVYVVDDFDFWVLVQLLSAL